MANSIVRLPLGYFPDPNRGRPLWNAKIYIGEPDLDPRILANQKTVTGRQEDGTELPLSQPIETSNGGIPVDDNGNYVTLLVDGAYSMSVDDKKDVQVYYFDNVLDGEPITLADMPEVFKEFAPDYSYIPFNTVADAKAGLLKNGETIDLAIGDYVRTGGYNSVNDGGGASYVVVAGGTGVDDGGSYHDTASGNQLELIIEGAVLNAEVFGISSSVADNTTQVQNALNALDAGATLTCPQNEVFIGGQVTIDKPVTITGGRFKSREFRIKSGDVTISHCQFTAPEYLATNRAIKSYPYEDDDNYENIRILHCEFDGFFYSTDFRAREYDAAESDPANRTLNSVWIIGCKSTAPTGVNAGHFQHIGVTNTKCIGCETYGGQNATSYNFINGNGDLVVQGCYDENNSYGSIEIENNDIVNGTVSGNVFGSDLWIDDSSNISVTGNVCKTLRVTTETNDSNNIIITGNQALRIRVEQFGAAPTGLAYNISIQNNQTTGLTSGQECFLGAIVTGTVSENSFDGGGDTSIGLSRRTGMDLLIRNNKGTAPIAISSTGGNLIEYGNTGMGVVTTDNTGVHLSRMMNANENWLDLPGFYCVGGEYTGSIAPSGTANVSFSIPIGSGLDFRQVGFKIIIRDTGSNNASFLRYDAVHVVVGAVVALNFGSPYSLIGVDSGGVTLSNNSSTADSVSFTVTNSSAKTLQVQVISEFSSRLTETT